MRTESNSGADEILSAARDLFAERGFEAVSVSAIAQRAGSSKANVFHHFQNKEELYNQIMQGAVDRMTDEFQHAITSESDPSIRIERAIEGSLAVMFEDPERADLIFREVVESDPSRGKALAETMFRDVYTTLTRLFEGTRRSGEGVTQTDANFLAFLLLSSNLMLFHCRHVVRHLPANAFIVDRDAYVHRLRDALLKAMETSEGARG